MTDSTMAPLTIELELMTPQQLKDWREGQDLTQAKLAEHLEISLGTVRKYEQGERKIPAFMWRALRDLATDLEEPKPSPSKRRQRRAPAAPAAEDS